MGLFNVQSAERTDDKSHYLNVADGIILTEALRYAINKISRLGLLRAGFSYQITDCREARVPFSTYQDVLVINGLTSFQTTSYFISNLIASAPMVNVLSSSGSFDHKNISTSSLMFKMDEIHYNLFRSIPSDDFEIRAIIDILKRFHLTFISVISANDLRTQESVEKFKLFASKAGVCIGTTVWVSVKPNNYEYRSIITRLVQNNFPKVIVLFTSSNEALGILNAAEHFHDVNFVSWTGLRASVFEANFKSRAARGLVLLQNSETYDEGFKEYFMNLTLEKNQYSWFAEYWSMVFNCSIPESYKLLASSTYDERPPCIGNENLTDEKVDLRYANIKPLLRGLETLACALKKSENEATCDHASQECKLKIAQDAVKYMRQQSCKLDNFVLFNDLGFYGNSFRVLNFNGTRFNEVGNWAFDDLIKESKINVTIDDIVWREGKPPFSQCYHECEDGAVEDRGFYGDICCYKCVPCTKQQIVINNTCQDCPKYEAPDHSRSKCIQLPIVDIETKSFVKYILIGIASTGLILNTLTVITFVRYRHFKIVKATGRDLSLFILISLYFIFSFAFLFVLKPTLVVCGMQRFILSLCMNVCYTPLMLKTNRLYRIFKASKALVVKPSMVSTKSQLIICIALIAVQLLLDIVWVVSDRPAVHLETMHQKNEVALICKHDPVNAVLNLLPCFLLMAACTFFGYKTRNFPSNFNEAFSISITMYITCFMWAIYVPLLFLFEFKRDNLFVSSFLTACFMLILGIITLIGIFGSVVFKVFKYKDTVQQTSQFFHSENMPSHVSIVLSNRIGADAINTKRTPSPAYQRDIGTDPIVFEDESKPSTVKVNESFYECQNSCTFNQRDTRTDHNHDKNPTFSFSLDKRSNNQRLRKRLASI